GILICGSGIGMSISANKIRGIRAALCLNEYMARKSIEDNDANVLCLGGRVIGIELAKSIVDAWFSATFQGGRHQKRLQLISEFENN
ncbi:MAG: RpiB/LacA/LacB family sugar-phosphate isomerase, partial [Candidatus Parvarchaeota archaeon]